MKSVLTSCIDSTLSTNIIYSPSEVNDSICPLQSFEEEAFEVYVPAKHYLPSRHLDSNITPLENLFFVIIFMIIFAFIRLRGKELLPHLIYSAFKRKKTEVIINEGIFSNLVCYILSLCLSFSILSVFASYLISEEFITLYSFYIFSGLVLYHFALLILIKILGWTFNSQHLTNEAIVNLWTYHIMIGLISAPAVIALFFIQNSSISLLINMILFCLIFVGIVKIIRWTEILFAYRVSILYMILYLCALEVMPLLVLYKIVA